MYFHSACVKNVFVVTLQRSGTEDEASCWEQHLSPFESLLPSTTWGHKPLRPTFFQRTKENYVISSAAKSGQRRNAVILSRYIDAMDAEEVMACERGRGAVSVGGGQRGGACPSPSTPMSSSCSRKPETPVTGEERGGRRGLCVARDPHNQSRKEG